MDKIKALFFKPLFKAGPVTVTVGLLIVLAIAFLIVAKYRMK